MAPDDDAGRHGDVATGFSITLLRAGAALCVLGAAGLVAGAWINLPPAAVIALAKALPFAVGGGLMLFGASVRRAARRRGLQQARVVVPLPGCSEPGAPIVSPHAPMVAEQPAERAARLASGLERDAVAGRTGKRDA